MKSSTFQPGLSYRLVVCNQSLETQVTMLQCIVAGGRTKGVLITVLLFSSNNVVAMTEHENHL